MENVNVIRKMLRRIGFSHTFAALITGYQGVESIDELQFLDNERVMNICRLICCPGVTDTNNNPNHGQKISLKSRKTLKLVIYYVKHTDRVSCDMTVAHISIAYIREL